MYHLLFLFLTLGLVFSFVLFAQTLPAELLIHYKDIRTGRMYPELRSYLLAKSVLNLLFRIGASKFRNDIKSLIVISLERIIPLVIVKPMSIYFTCIPRTQILVAERKDVKLVTGIDYARWMKKSIPFV